MFKDLRECLFNDGASTPSKFTIHLGKLVREARKDMGLSQAELAKKIYRRQATVSDIENGKTEPTASTLLQLSYVLQKPIGYFIPYGIVELQLNELEPEEQELIFQVRRLVNYASDPAEIIKLIKQVKALADHAEDNLSRLDTDEE